MLHLIEVNKMMIAIIESESDSELAYLSEVLKIESNKYYFLKNSVDGLEYSRDHKPEIIIITEQLKYVEGFEMAKEISYIYNPYILYIGNKEDIKNICNDMRRYITHYISTPIDPLLLATIIRNIPRKKGELLHRPKLIKMTYLIENEALLVSFIQEIVAILGTQLSIKKQRFLVKAVKEYMCKNVVYKGLALKYNIMPNSAYKRLRKIVSEVCPGIRNLQLIKVIADHVIKNAVKCNVKRGEED